jgi:hypothetical protein
MSVILLPRQEITPHQHLSEHKRLFPDRNRWLTKRKSSIAASFDFARIVLDCLASGVRLDLNMTTLTGRNLQLFNQTYPTLAAMRDRQNN